MTTQDESAPQGFIDPVCGKSIDPTAMCLPHVYGGAMFCFCSEACRTRFVAEPEQYVQIRATPATTDPLTTPAAVTDDIVTTATIPPAVARATAPAPTEPGILKAHSTVSFMRSTAHGRRLSEPQLRRSGLRSFVNSQVLAWREGRYAARTSRELLALYRTVTAAHPGLADRALYRHIVMERTGCDAVAAEQVLDNAEESFAMWPARRELTFCDVVHYLSVVGFLAKHQGEHWMHADIAHIVASRLPHELCAVKHGKPS